MQASTRVIRNDLFADCPETSREDEWEVEEAPPKPQPTQDAGVLLDFSFRGEKDVSKNQNNPQANLALSDFLGRRGSLMDLPDSKAELEETLEAPPPGLLIFDQQDSGEEEETMSNEYEVEENNTKFSILGMFHSRVGPAEDPPLLGGETGTDGCDLPVHE